MNAGLFLCMAGMVLLCALDAVVKSLGGELTVFQIAFARYAGAALWLALFIALTRSSWPDLRNWRRHLIRAALMVMTATSFFYGVTHLPLAIVSALALSAPVYVSLFGILFLKEKPTPMLGGAVLLGIAGSLVIVFGGGGPIEVEGANDLLAWGAALFAPISYAGALVLLKHHADSEDSAALSLASAMFAAPLVLPLAVPGFEMPAVDLWWQIGLTGLLGAVGFVLLTTGLRKTTASAFAIVDYTSVLWAALFGFVFFAEVPQLRFWLGGVLIVGACAIGMHANNKAPTPAAT